MPYFVKWTNGEPWVNPVFTNVTIDNALSATTSTYADLNGIYTPVTLEANNKSVLYLSDNNLLYYPTADVTVGAFRAYFTLNGLTAGEPTTATGVNTFILNLGNGDPSSIDQIEWSMVNGQWSIEDGQWYTVSGVRLQGQPQAKGLYIKNGKKIVIK